MFKCSQANACNLLGIRTLVDADLKALCDQALERYYPTPGAVKELITLLLVQACRILEGSSQNLKPAQDPAYGERLSQALYGVSEQGLPFKFCRVCVWVLDPSAVFEDPLQDPGFEWVPEKGCWFLQPTALPKDPTHAFPDEACDLECIRSTYGSQKVA